MTKCCCPPIPDSVKDLMSCSDKLLFTGTYDVNSFNYGDLDTTTVNLSVLPNSTNILNTPFNLFQALPNNPQKLITEYYNITSWSQDLQKQFGFISFVNTYPTEKNVKITIQPVLQFGVAAKFGIFRSVDKVIIDYTNPIRVMYFFKKNRH
jgi:hypothetical protein